MNSPKRNKRSTGSLLLGVYRSHSDSNWWLIWWISRVLIYTLDFALIRGRPLLLSDLTTKTILSMRGISLPREGRLLHLHCPPLLLYHWFCKPSLSGGMINLSSLSRWLRSILRLWLIRPVKFGIHYSCLSFRDEDLKLVYVIYNVLLLFISLHTYHTVKINPN